MGAHVWGPAYLRDHLLPHGQVAGWTRGLVRRLPRVPVLHGAPVAADRAAQRGPPRHGGVRPRGRRHPRPRRCGDLLVPAPAPQRGAGRSGRGLRSRRPALRRGLQARHRAGRRVAPGVRLRVRAPGRHCGSPRRRCSRSRRCRSSSTGASRSTAATSRRRWRASSPSRSRSASACSTSGWCSRGWRPAATAPWPRCCWPSPGCATSSRRSGRSGPPSIIVAVRFRLVSASLIPACLSWAGVRS